MILRLSSAELLQAAKLQEQIESVQSELELLVGTATTPTAEPKRRRKISAAGRARIAAAQRARWAKVNGTELSLKKAKRKVSAAARAKMAAAAKARWKKAKAAGKSRL